MNSRDVALNVLLDIESNKTFSNIALSKALRQNQFEDKKDRAFVTRLVEGTTEYRIKLDYVINQFSKTGINKCKPLIRCLLRMGAYQIIYMDSVPSSAACNETVKLAKKHGFGSLSGFVNGVLRSISRAYDDNGIEYPDETENEIKYLSIKYSMPEWLVNKIISDYPKEGKRIIEGTFEERATTIRVNECNTDTKGLRELLEGAGLCVMSGAYTDKALRISNYDFVRKIPGYRQGLFTVQDESSICAVADADIKPGNIVFDVCAAPGGKTSAAAEYLKGTGRIYSMDISEDKLELIAENIERLGFENVKILAHDATVKLTPSDLDMDGETVMADVVIADLPCSGLGILGRKNDIKYRVVEEDLHNLTKLQKQILSVVREYVKPHGTLLYSTCTINPDENQNNVRWFLEENKDFYLEKERLFLQGVDECDGFYYAVLRRNK